MRTVRLALLGAFVAGSLAAAPPTITTFAGNGQSGFAGDGGPAAEATLGLALDSSATVAFDRDGNVYIPDSLNNRIRRVDAKTKVITTFAGDGEKRFRGDGGPAIAASFNHITDLAFDKAGALYVADAMNHRIRRIATDGKVETIAGLGVPKATGDGGPAKLAGLSRPVSICFDPSGNLIVGEAWAGRVRRIDGKTGVITTIAGSGENAFGVADGPATKIPVTSPVSVRCDAKGNVYIADSGDNVVMKVDPQSNALTIVAGTGLSGFKGDGGPARAAVLNQPAAVALDGDGNLFIADWLNHRVRRVDAKTGVIETVAGSGTTDRHGQSRFSGEGKHPTQAQLNQPAGLAFDAKGNLYITDTLNARIRVVMR